MSAARVLAIGECMAELAPSDQPGEFRLGFAGDTFNTAWYLARIAPGVRVSYLSAVGDDAISDEMRTFVRDSGISDAHIQQIPGETVGLYMIKLQGGERSFSYWRGQSAAKQLARDPVRLDAAIAAADLVYFSGITLAILDGPSRDTLFSALDRGRAAGKTIAFDTNLRPRLWPNASEMTETVMRAAPHADIILPSFDDEAEWFGDIDAQATLERYARVGVRQIIVKNSAAPVVFQNGDQRGEVAVTPARNVVDTTAAGDSFNAGVIAGLLHHGDMEAGIAMGCELARHVVQQRGALVAVERDSLEAAGE